VTHSCAGFAIFFLFMVGCAGRPVIRVEGATSAVPHASVVYASFGDAVDDFAPDAARSLALSPDERTYAVALEQFVAGRLSDCAETLASLARADAPSLRARALDLHEAVLMQLGAFRELGLISKDPDAGPVARAFGEAPPQHLDLPPDGSVVPATFSNAGSPMVDVAFDDHPAKLWIDSGAGFSVLSSDVAERTGVRAIDGIGARASIGTSGPGKRVDARLSVVDSLQVGALRGEHVPFVILPESELSFQILFVTLLKVEGILGWNVLKQLDVTIDYPRASVRFHLPQASNGERNLFWYGMPMAIASTADGRNFYLGVDTGASRSYLTPHGARKLHAIDGTSDGSSVSEVSFVLSDTMIHVSKLSVKSMPRAPAGMDGVLGNDVLSRGTLHLDSSAGRIDFTVDK
jgi:predicted aspartyl protease